MTSSSNAFFYKNEKTEFRKILTNTFAFRNLIYNGRHFKWQCIISKRKLNTCAAIEGRCTLVVRSGFLYWLVLLFLSWTNERHPFNRGPKQSTTRSMIAEQHATAEEMLLSILGCIFQILQRIKTIINLNWWPRFFLDQTVLLWGIILAMEK